MWVSHASTQTTPERAAAIKARLMNPPIIKKLAAIAAPKASAQSDAEIQDYPIRNYDSHITAHYAWLRENNIERDVSLIEIMRHFYDICPYNRKEINSLRRDFKLVAWRQALIHVVKRETDLSLPNIGKKCGDRDHTTVLHSVRCVDKAIADGLAEKHVLANGVEIFVRFKRGKTHGQAQES